MQCPYCSNHFTPTNLDYESYNLNFRIEDKDFGYKLVLIRHIVCPNLECKKPITSITITGVITDNAGFELHKSVIFDGTIIPQVNIKQYPDYIPEQLRQDYEEASKIIELSPKAAATLARRCLQGIIRDYFGITKSRLVDEINALKGVIAPELWDAIDALRQIGNIGAHMEKDVNLIINIEPDEARQLVWLIETLFENLYVHRAERQKRLKAIQNIAAAKDAQKKGLPAIPATSGTTLLTS